MFRASSGSAQRELLVVPRMELGQLHAREVPYLLYCLSSPIASLSLYWDVQLSLFDPSFPLRLELAGRDNIVQWKQCEGMGYVSMIEHLACLYPWDRPPHNNNNTQRKTDFLKIFSENTE